jgi:hypothetical protein
VRQRIGGGRGADRRGTGRRRQGRSPVARRREAKREEALVSGGRHGMEDAVARGRAGGTGSIGLDGGGGGVRAGGAGLNGRAGGTRRVGRAVRGQAGECARRAGDAGVRVRRGAPAWLGWLVGPSP